MAMSGPMLKSNCQQAPRRVPAIRANHQSNKNNNLFCRPMEWQQTIAKPILTVRPAFALNPSLLFFVVFPNGCWQGLRLACNIAVSTTTHTRPMMFDPKQFDRGSDFRGDYPRQVNEELAFFAGRYLVRF